MKIVENTINHRGTPDKLPLCAASCLGDFVLVTTINRVLFHKLVQLSFNPLAVFKPKYPVEMSLMIQLIRADLNDHWINTWAWVIDRTSSPSHPYEELTITPTNEELKTTPTFSSCANNVLYKNYSGTETGVEYPAPEEAQGIEWLIYYPTFMAVAFFHLHCLSSSPSLLPYVFLLYKQFCKIKPVLLNWWCCTFSLLCTLIWAEDFNTHWIITPVGHTLPDAPLDTLGQM